MRRVVGWLLWTPAVLLLLGATLALVWLYRSLPGADGRVVLAGLEREVAVTQDGLAVPVIRAGSRVDAYRALGYLHARDRLFQMDLARRKSAGELAEILGDKLLATDRRQRVYQARQAARTAAAALPPEQRTVLEAYAEGVNALMASLRAWPPEIELLGYRPGPWRAEDSLLVAFGMFQTLTTQEQDERMLTVMQRELPPEVFAFLTPDADEYGRPLVGGSEPRRPAQPIPLAALATLIGERSAQPLHVAVDADGLVAGSNQWAVGGRKTRDGRAMVANDMHLALGLPNTWYRAELHYGAARLAGVTLPGLPLLIAGSNGAVAWGFTNVDADVMDLVRIETDPADPDTYRTPAGPVRFDTHTETIQVRGAEALTVDLRRTIWGPILPDPLLGAAVALRWTALQPQAMNLGLLEMDGAMTLERAMAVMNRCGIPPQNVVLADSEGRIAWTYAGVFPKRRGFDGLVARSWADGAVGWEGFLPPEALPRLIDPVDGYIATANNRTLGREYPHLIGHNFSHGFRAFRIAQRLAAMEAMEEADLLQLQLDTGSEFFEFYRRLVLELTATPSPGGGSELADARRSVEAWDGRMEADSRGIALLVRFRQRLAATVFEPFLRRCAQAESGFAYAWREMETPLRALLQQRPEAALPDRRHASWRGFLSAELESIVRQLRADYAIDRVDELTWGRVNEIHVRHPFGRLIALLSPFVDMPVFGSAGCSGYCVRILSGEHGASERFVISPNHAADGLFHMPGGQSGHPLSAHYRDQHQAWVDGAPLPFEAGVAEHGLTLLPAGAD
ncbi:penicillin acylase family protein [Methylolobus aquaticus]|nr:penicillin acylase family protein [Methylolobus aquaticus]